MSKFLDRRCFLCHEEIASFSHELLDNISWMLPFTTDYTKAGQVLSVANHSHKSDEIPVLDEEYTDFCTCDLPFPKESITSIDEY